MATMASKRDYYEVLGVSRTATDGQIAEAYRKLALQFHPDRNPGNEEAVDNFKEAAEAFEVLSHEEKRARYDRYGHAGLEGAGAAPHFRDISDIFDAFGDVFGQGIFGDLFGGRRGRGRRVRRGADVRCQISLTLEEAYHGTKRTIRFDRHEPCETCQGSGAKPGTQPESCRYCGGQGRVVQSHYSYRLMSSSFYIYTYGPIPESGRVCYTRPNRIVTDGEPIFKTQKQLKDRAVVADAFTKCGSVKFPVERPGIGYYGHRDGYNVLYGDWHVAWYGDPQERFIWRAPLYLSGTSKNGAFEGTNNNIICDWTEGKDANGVLLPDDDGYAHHTKKKKGAVYLWHQLDEQGGVDVGVND